LNNRNSLRRNRSTIFNTCAHSGVVLNFPVAFDPICIFQSAICNLKFPFNSTAPLPLNNRNSIRDTAVRHIQHTRTSGVVLNNPVVPQPKAAGAAPGAESSPVRKSSPPARRNRPRRSATNGFAQGNHEVMRAALAIGMIQKYK
jgi:hypothetical protein